jgi:hypothetical protein
MPEGFTQIVEITPAMRALIEDAIESLILLLDEIDGDAELEDGGDAEPTLGAGESPFPQGAIIGEQGQLVPFQPNQAAWGLERPGTVDEAEIDDDEDGADAEPSLSSTVGFGC